MLVQALYNFIFPNPEVMGFFGLVISIATVWLEAVENKMIS